MQTLYDIITKNYTEISDIAALVGIDWSKHASTIELDATYKTNVSVIEKRFTGKVGIKTITKYTRDNRPYPFIIFRTFKGGDTVTWSGYKSLEKPTKQTAKQAAQQAQAIAERKAATEAKQAAQQASELLERDRERAESLELAKSFTQCTDSVYLSKKHLLDARHIFRSGVMYGKKAITVDLYNEHDDLVGYHGICDQTGKKMLSKGVRGGLYFAPFQMPEQTKTAFITEGVADAITIVLATQCDTYSAIGTNYAPLVNYLCDLGYDEIIIAADNDQNLAGQKAAIKAAQTARAPVKVVIPSVLNDFNDVFTAAINQGTTKEAAITAVKNELNNVIFESDHLIEKSRYFSIKPVTNAINLLIGEKGTGKTSVIRRVLEELPQTASVIVVSYRVILGAQIANDFGLEFYDQIKDIHGSRALDKYNRIVVSPEALTHISPNKKFDFLILDESEQAGQHIAKSRTMKGNNRTNTQKLLALATNAKTVILADADAKTFTSEFASIVSANSNKKIITLTNTYKPRAERGDTVTVYESKNTLITEFECSVSLKSKTVAMANSRSQAEKLASIAARYGNVLLITSKTRKEHEKELEKSPTDYVKKFDTVVYSPCFGTGFSVDGDHGFSEAYAFFKGGIITAESCAQMLARFRELGTYYVHISEYKSCYPVTMRELEKALIKKPLDFTLSQLDIAPTGEYVIDNFSRLYLAAELEQNKSLNNFKKHLLYILKSEGFTISENDSDHEVSDAAKEAIKEAKNEQKQAKQEKLEEKAQELAASFADITHEQAMNIAIADEKIKLFTRAIPNIQISKMSCQQTKKLDRIEIGKSELEEVSKIELTHYEAKRKIIKSACKLIGFDLETMTLTERKLFKADSPEARQTAKFSDSVYSFFRVKLNTTDNVKAIRQLAKLIGLSLHTVGKNEYAIDEYSINALKTAFNLIPITEELAA